MIIDNVNNFSLYPTIPKQLLSFIELSNFKQGKNDIEEDKIFAIGLEYETKDASEGLWEAHRKYLDIHYIIEGEEKIYISNIDDMKASNEYQDDYQLFEGVKSHEVLLRKGDFLVLYPHEVHKTSIMNTAVSDIRKFVFKILIN